MSFKRKTLRYYYYYITDQTILYVESQSAKCLNTTVSLKCFTAYSNIILNTGKFLEI